MGEAALGVLTGDSLEERSNLVMEWIFVVATGERDLFLFSKLKGREDSELESVNSGSAQLLVTFSCDGSGRRGVFLPLALERDLPLLPLPLESGDSLLTGLSG